ncbi:MAG: rod shape-determining protein MreC [Microthrixaceae bacterium]
MLPGSKPESGRRKSRYLLLILTLAAITIATLDARGVGIISSARDSSRDALGPVGDFGNWVSTPFRNAWNGITNYDDLKQENERLQQQVDELKTNGMREKRAQRELKKLREQLNISFLADMPTQIARVDTARASNFDDNRVEIDKGADHGLAVGNPVVTKAGLVGRLTNVSRTRSVVQLISDPDFHIGVSVGKDQIHGVGHGNGDANTFIVDRGIELGREVRVNDYVFAGGIERSLVPSDLYIPIGTVKKVTPDAAERVQNLQVELSARLDRLDVVQVLKWTPSD